MVYLCQLAERNSKKLGSEGEEEKEGKLPCRKNNVWEVPGVGRS